MYKQLVMEYRYSDEVISVYGCYDDMTPDGLFDFFDIYDVNGRCLNEGEPFIRLPYRSDCAFYLKNQPT